MRIAKNTLYRRWFQTSIAALVLFLVLMALHFRLRALTGFGPGDLRGLSAPQLRSIFYAWSPAPYAASAGFSLGLGYLFMPLYGAAFFYSGVIAREAFAPKPGRVRRLLAFAAMVPVAGAVCGAFANALLIGMFVSGAGGLFARLAARLSEAQFLAFLFGVALLAAALASRFVRSRPAPKSGIAA